MRFVARFLLFVVLLASALASGCSPPSKGVQASPLSSREGNLPSQTATASPVRVELTWAYADAQRLGLELRVEGYPLPANFEIDERFFPISAVDLVSRGKRIPLYRNFAIYGVNASNEVWRNARVYLAKEHQRGNKVDFLLSFAYFGKEANRLVNQPVAVRVELGEFQIDVAPGVKITLPAQGVFTLPISFSPSNPPWRTYGPQPAMEAEGVTAELKRLFINPSTTWFDACLSYPDTHQWIPVGALNIGGRVVTADPRDTHDLVPFNPHNAQEILTATRRCFAFTIPLFFPHRLEQSFQVGISQIKITRTDSNFLRMEECETAKRKVEGEFPGVTLRCLTFQLRGRRQIWFEIVSLPPSLNRAVVYNHMLNALTTTLTHGWYWQIQP